MELTKVEKSKKLIALLSILVLCNLTINIHNCFCQFAPLPIPGNPAIISAMGSGMYGGNFFIMMAAQDAGIFRSTNLGNDWIQINSGLTNLNIWDIKYINNEFWATSSNGGIFKTTNAGNNWIPKNSGIPSDFVFEIDYDQFSNDLYAIVYNNGFFVSTDLGSSWNASNSGLTTLSLRSFEIYNSNLFVGTLGNGVFKSTNNGNNWILSNNGMINANIHDIIRTATYYFGAGFNGGVYRSGDGSYWTQVNNGLGNLGVYSLESPGGSLDISGSDIFAGTAGGFYASSNDGNNWALRNEGFSGPPEILAIFTTGSYIFAGTNGQGLWRRPLSDIIGIEKISTEIPGSFSLFQNYPNPFNPTTKIKFSIPLDSRIRGNDNLLLVVYDALGRDVATLVNEQLLPGTYEVEWNGSKYASGVYYYTLSTGSYINTKKMILIK